MYAVIKTGGKQYKVAPGEKLKVEQIPADVGAEVMLDQVLMVGEGEASVWAAHRPGARSRPRSSRTVAATRSGSSRCAGASITRSTRAIAGLHRAQDRRHRRLTLDTNRTTAWHTKKQAAVPATAATRIPSASASRRTAAKRYRRRHHRAPARHPGPSRRQRRHRQGPHAVRAGRRQGGVPVKGAKQHKFVNVDPARVSAGARSAFPRCKRGPQRRGFLIADARSVRPCSQRRSIHHSMPTATLMNDASGNAAENSGGQSLITPRFENSRPSRKNARPEHRPREDPKADAARAALEMRERQREHHHRDHRERIEHLVPERDLEARRLLLVAAEHADVVVERTQLELLRRDLVDGEDRGLAAPFPTSSSSAGVTRRVGAESRSS